MSLRSSHAAKADRLTSQEDGVLRLHNVFGPFGRCVPSVQPAHPISPPQTQTLIPKNPTNLDAELAMHLNSRVKSAIFLQEIFNMPIHIVLGHRPAILHPNISTIELVSLLPLRLICELPFKRSDYQQIFF
jgi:hypothetical protein